MKWYLFRTLQWRELAFRVVHEDGPHWIARHTPKRIVYWCAIVLWANATSGKWENENPSAVMMHEALGRWTGR